MRYDVFIALSAGMGNLCSAWLYGAFQNLYYTFHYIVITEYNDRALRLCITITRELQTKPTYGYPINRDK